METNSLPDLVLKLKEYDELEIKAQESGDVLPDELYYEKEITKSLIAGRVDQAVELRAAVKLREEALQEALRKTGALLENIDTAFESAIKMGGSNRLDGLAWSARLQNNSRASTVIEDEKLIPDQFKFKDYNISARVPLNANDQHRFWCGVILRRPVNEQDYKNLSESDRKTVNDHISEYVNKTEIESVLKKDPQGVPGAKLERGQHLRIGKGESKPKSLPKTKEQ